MKKQLLAALAAGSLVLTGCGTYTSTAGSTESSAAASTAAAEGEEAGASSSIDKFTFIATEPTSLNMVTSQTELDNFAFYLTQEMLFRPYQGVYSPEVVDTYEVSDDHLTYTYHLKKTNWPDGEPITAADFAYYLTAILDPDNGSGVAADLITNYGFVNAEAYNNGECGVEDVGIQAPDDDTLVFTLAAPMADFDGTNIQVYPLRRSFFEAQGQSYGGTVENYESSGPYILKDWTIGSSLTYEKNPDWLYADEQFPAKTVVEINGTDTNTSISMFENGEADAMYYVATDYADQLKDYVTFNFGSSLRMVQFNTTGQGDEAKAALLSNRNFQMALAYALNRTAINQAVNKSNKAVNRFLNEPLKGNTDDTYFPDDYPLADAVPLDGDADKAKEYLQAALDELGYASAADLPTLGYLTFDNDRYRTMAETIVDQWKQVLGLENIEINLQPIPNAIQLMCTLQYDIYYTSLAVGVTPSTFLNGWVTDGSVNNPAGVGNIFSNEEYDRILDEASQEFDREKRMALYAKAEEILNEEGPFFPVNVDGSYYAQQSYVKNFIVAQTDNAIEINDLEMNK